MWSSRSQGNAPTCRSTKKKVTEIEQPFGDPRPQSPKLSPEEIKQTIAQFKSLPPEQKKKLALHSRTSCSWCEKELGVANTSPNHGICQRHMAKQYADMGVPYKPKEVKFDPDLSKLSKDELNLLVRLAAIRKSRRNYGKVKEGRCEDWPCCGHGDDCPDRDPETGEEVWGCAHCGAPLPRGARSSLCNRCIQDMHRRMDDPTGQDLDNWQQ